jgi:hypothetical protein
MNRPIIRLATWCCVRFATVGTSTTIIAGQTCYSLIGEFAPARLLHSKMNS